MHKLAEVEYRLTFQTLDPRPLMVEDDFRAGTKRPVIKKSHIIVKQEVISINHEITARLERERYG
jgi:hypothetical protein